jgi:hypothetical protein
MAVSIDEASAVVVDEIAGLVQASRPTEHDILDLQEQLFSRHSELPGLEPIVSSALPDCVNASHRAVMRVCLAVPRHDHLAIQDDQWTAGWDRMQVRHPSVNVKVPGRRSSRHADLYVIAGGHVVSLEFKYVAGKSLRDPEACIEQMRRHAEHHEHGLFVVYSASGTTPDLSQVRSGLLANARLVHVDGPAIAPVEG